LRLYYIFDIWTYIHGYKLKIPHRKLENPSRLHKSDDSGQNIDMPLFQANAAIKSRWQGRSYRYDRVAVSMKRMGGDAEKVCVTLVLLTEVHIIMTVSILKE